MRRRAWLGGILMVLAGLFVVMGTILGLDARRFSREGRRLSAEVVSATPDWCPSSSDPHCGDTRIEGRFSVPGEGVHTATLWLPDGAGRRVPIVYEAGPSPRVETLADLQRGQREYFVMAAIATVAVGAGCLVVWGARWRARRLVALMRDGIPRPGLMEVVGPKTIVVKDASGGPRTLVRLLAPVPRPPQPGPVPVGLLGTIGGPVFVIRTDEGDVLPASYPDTD